MQWLRQRFELSHGNSGNAIRPMEGLRGLAVFLVFLVHYVSLAEPWMPHDGMQRSAADALHTVGNAGVDLFFVLSGYLIYGSLISRPQLFLPFIRRRVQRIYPAFSVVFAIYCALSLLMPVYAKIPSPPTAGALYLLQNFLLLPGLFPIEPLITVAWSLSYEVAYYLALPPLIALLDLRRRSVALRMGLFVAIAAVIVGLCAAYGGPLRMIMFISGILLYDATARDTNSAPSSAAGMLALAGGLLFLLAPTSGWAGHALKVVMLFVCFFVLCYACIGNAEGWLARSFCWRPLRWLGNMSYSYYLIHGLALKAAGLALAFVVPFGERGALFFVLMLPAMFVCTLVPSALLFLSIERPLSLAPRRSNSPTERARQASASSLSSSEREPRGGGRSSMR